MDHLIIRTITHKIHKFPAAPALVGWYITQVAWVSIGIHRQAPAPGVVGTGKLLNTYGLAWVFYIRHLTRLHIQMTGNPIRR